MCILKIHAASHTANGIQSAAHNMDTNAGDLATMIRVLESRGHKLEAERLRLAAFHVNKARDIAWSVWDGFIADSPNVDTPPIGAENMPVHHNEYGAYFHHADNRPSMHDVPTITTAQYSEWPQIASKPMYGDEWRGLA